MNTKATTKKMFDLAPNDDSSAIVKFIDIFNREPKTNNGDWIEVKRLLPIHPISTAESDYALKVWRSKAAIINYWKSKKK